MNSGNWKPMSQDQSEADDQAQRRQKDDPTKRQLNKTGD